MRILGVDRDPLHELPYRVAIPGGGSAIRRLPIVRGRVDRLPHGLDALLVASDLQGVSPSGSPGGEGVLLGEMLAGEIARLATDGVVPPVAAMGVILAGDLHAPPEDACASLGDVRDVWLAFAHTCRWVAGVAGNHDHFGDHGEAARFRERPGIHLLDGDVTEVDGLRVGGVGLIIGKPRGPGKPSQPNRRSADEHIGALQRVLDERPDIVILHEGPNGDSSRQYGNPRIRAALEASDAALVICGHDHWFRPLASIDVPGRGPLQILNVEGRAVLLTPGPA